MDLKLNGKRALITGASRGLGYATALGLGREGARLAITKLIADGRIHPGRIEEVVAKARAEVDLVIRQAGEQAVFEANCGDFHEEIVKILGRLRYRTSYGQNVLKHTLEVVHLAGIMASELDASVKTAKRAALLHDLGKALTHEVEGSHALIGAEIARKYGEQDDVEATMLDRVERLLSVVYQSHIVPAAL